MDDPPSATPLAVTQTTPADVAEVVQKSVDKWLKNTEVVDILNNYKDYAFYVSQEAPVTPPGGTLFLFHRKKVRFFRKDGHNWRKKPDGKTVRETHEKLKVDNQDVLNCYYAHAEEPEGEFQLQRRCYWLLEGDTNIVLVHYLNIPADAMRARPDRPDEQGYLEAANDEAVHAMDRLRMDPLASGQMDNGILWHHSSPHSMHHGMPIPQLGYGNPNMHAMGMAGVGGAERSRMNQVDQYGNWINPAAQQMTSHPGQRSQYSSYGPNGSNMQGSMNQGPWQSQAMAQEAQVQHVQAQQAHRNQMHAHAHAQTHGQGGAGYAYQAPGMQQYAAGPSTSNGQPQYSQAMQGGSGYGPQPHYGMGAPMPAGNMMQQGWRPGAGDQASMQGMQPAGAMQPPNATNIRYGYWQSQQQQQQQQQAGCLPHQRSPYPDQGNALQCSPVYSSSHDSKDATPSNSGMGGGGPQYQQHIASAHQSPKPEMFSEGQQRASHMPAASQPEACFQISDFSPSWDYTTGGGKILITGTPINLPEGTPLSVMFGDTEVPAVQLQPGVLRCQAPPSPPGQVAICITQGDGTPCSASVAFKYTLPIKDPPRNVISSITTETSNRDLQVKLVSRLLRETGGSLTGDESETQANIGEEEHTKLVDAAMARVCALEAEHAERVLELLLERELKIFTQQVIDAHESDQPAARSLINQVDADGMGLIHVVAALGYEWAVELLLASGANESLRDPWGLTPLHWAAAKGHEDVVALLLRNGASCHALSYSVGTFGGFAPADLASMHNHNGIAAYLSESHLAQMVARIGGLDISDDPAAMFRKRNRNSVSQIAESAPEAEAEARNISDAAREAAERIYLATGNGASADTASAWKGDTPAEDFSASGILQGDTSQDERRDQNAAPCDDIDAKGKKTAGSEQDGSTTRISKDAPELYQAMSRVDAIVHNKFAREQYIRMRQAAERNQVSIVPNPDAND